MTIASLITRCIGITTLLVFALPASAQDTSTGSTTAPQTFDEKLEDLKMLLKWRSIGSREDVSVNADVVAQLTKDRLAYEKDLALKREQCVTAIRRANRDTKLSTTEACFRSDLLLQMAFLRKENAYLKQLGGMKPDRSTLAFSANETLSDAMATIINAIDSDVYDDPAQLESAKQKLWQQYQRQRYLTLGIVRADRMLGWIGLLAQRIHQLWTDGEPTEETKVALRKSVDCLMNSASIVNSYLSIENYESTKEPFGQYQSSLKKCAESLRAAVRYQKGFPVEPEDGQSSSSEAASGAANSIKE